MSHQRQIIRDAVKTMLTDATSVGDKVVTNISTPLWRDKLPYIVIWTQSEDVTEFEVAPRSIKRALALIVEVHVTDVENVNCQNTLDDIALEVENLMAVDHTLGGTCEDHILQSVELAFLGEGDQPVSVCRMTFEVLYVTDVPTSMDDQNTHANIENFAGADVQIDVGADDQIDAEDTIDVEEI